MLVHVVYSCVYLWTCVCMCVTWVWRPQPMSCVFFTLNPPFRNFIYLFWVCGCISMHAHDTWMEVRGQLEEISSLLPSFGHRNQAWQQESSPSEPSHQPLSTTLVFEAESLIEPRAHLFGKNSWSASPRESSCLCCPWSKITRATMLSFLCES